MDDALIENNNNNSEQYKRYISFRKKYTINSIDSLPDFDNKLYLSKIIVAISFISLILGIYIIINKGFYLNPVYNFSKNNLIFYYIIIFTFGLLGSLLLSFFIALIIKSIYIFKKCLKSNNEENEIILENNENIIPIENTDNISVIAYTLTISIILNIILYLIGFPISFYLIYALIKNKFYSKYTEFFILYLFIFINDISGAIFFFVFYSFIKTKTQNSLRKMSFAFDEDNLLNAYQEVKDAINLAN